MIRLFKNYYIDPDKARDAELIEVRRRDQANPLIGQIVNIGGRPTFADIFRRVNEVAELGDISIVANADICFDDTLSGVPVIGSDDCWALSRWEDTDALLELRVSDDSQDAWIFRGPIRQKLIDTANFPPGKAGCDNALLARIATAGYKASNPAKSIRAIHLHSSGVRRYSKRREDAVPKPYLLIAPGKLGDVPKMRWIR